MPSNLRHDRQPRRNIRDLGDWTRKMQAANLANAEAIVEGPYGRFKPYGYGEQTVWVAGGVGITPFLSAIDGLAAVSPQDRPTLFYCVSQAGSAVAIDALREAEAHNKLNLIVVDSSVGPRFNRRTLEQHFPSGLGNAHVAACGPAGLLGVVREAALKLGAKEVETESFDIRSGFGPDLSRDWDRLLTRS